MYAIFGVMDVKPGHEQAFEETIAPVGQASVRDELGVVQYHILADVDISTRYYFFEIFRDLAAAEAHWETEHFKAWWAEAESMLEDEPQRTCTMRPVFPSAKGLETQMAGLLNW